MSVSYIPEHVKLRLWGRAAGRCEYRGCNRPLWEDDLTRYAFNIAYVAHIVADKPEGPRGHPVQSEALKSALSNLMLLCDPHHRLVDIANVAAHPVETLVAMKAEHETRMTRIGAVAVERRSEVLLYGANIGETVRLPTYGEASQAMLPEWYPASDRPIVLSLQNARHEDAEASYWATESGHLRQAFKEDVRPLLRGSAPPHVSVFALAPQPLLVLLGALMTDIVPAEVYQRHREPPTWEWLPGSDGSGDRPGFIVEPPTKTSGPPALVLALSATVADERIHAVLGPESSIWRVTIEQPSNDFLRTRAQLSDLRVELRRVLDRIKAAHGQEAHLHLFPAAPVAACVELGRVLMPKADLPLRVYDEHRSQGGFRHALDIGLEG